MKRERFIQFAIAIYVIGGLILLFGNRDWFPDFYHPVSLGILSLLSPVLIFLPSLIFKTSDPRKRHAVKKLQIVLAAGLLLNAAGGLGLYRLYLVGFQYDKLMHFAVPLMWTLGIAEFRHQWIGEKFAKSLRWAAVLVLLGGIAWELREALTDWLFATQSWGEYGKNALRDTLWDLTMNILGILTAVGIWFLRKKSVLTNKLFMRR